MTDSTCRWGHALGRPGVGFHARRCLGLACWDVLGTVVLAVVSAWYWKKPLGWMLLVWFVGATVMHVAFGTQTALLRGLGIQVCG